MRPFTGRGRTSERSCIRTRPRLPSSPPAPRSCRAQARRPSAARATRCRGRVPWRARPSRHWALATPPSLKSTARSASARTRRPPSLSRGAWSGNARTGWRSFLRRRPFPRRFRPARTGRGIPPGSRTCPPPGRKERKERTTAKEPAPSFFPALPSPPPSRRRGAGLSRPWTTLPSWSVPPWRAYARRGERRGRGDRRTWSPRRRAPFRVPGRRRAAAASWFRERALSAPTPSGRTRKPPRW